MSYKLLLLALATLQLTNQLHATTQLSQFCPGRRIELEFFGHSIRVPVNSTQTVSTTAIVGNTDNTLPFSAGYGAVFNMKLTRGPQYNSEQIGSDQGSYFVPVDGSLTTLNDVILLNTTSYSGYVSAAGLCDFAATSNTLVVLGGVGKFFYSIGTVTVTVVSQYANGANRVRKYDLKLTIYDLQLCAKLS